MDTPTAYFYESPTFLNDVIEWDVPNWSRALPFWLNQTKLNLSSTFALEIGSRHGGISLWAALQGMQIVCSDLNGPTFMAINKHHQYGVENLVQYLALDGTHIPFDNCLDLVIFKSVLGGIGRDNHKERQEKAIYEIYRSMRPGGEVWFAENLTASVFHRYFRKKYVNWGEEWRYVTPDEMANFFRHFSSIKFQTIGFLGNLGRTPAQRAFLGKLDTYYFDRLVPAKHRYIMIGVAQK
jgi:SAM-dependent methyltransferase